MSIDTTTPTIKLPSDQDNSGRTLGEDEIIAVSEAILSGTLTSTKGRFTKELQDRFEKLLGVSHAYATTSGTAAIHTAIAAVDPEPGDEIVTSPITDMGALTPILYQAAIPVFADVDPATCNLTAETIERVLSPRTRAIIVTHLFGNPCQMQPIMELASSRGIRVIEDCAQAFLARSADRYVGTIGDVGCFSLQQGKHITTGEGGLVTSRDDDLARRMFLYINKAWGYGDPQPDHYFLALNYRMSELQGAVALAQLNRLESVVNDRIAAANALTRQLNDVSGIEPPCVAANAVHTYWKYVVGVDADEVPGGTVGFGERLRQAGIACAPRYIQKPAFQCDIFQNQRTFGQSRFPFTLARPEAVDYRKDKFPGTFGGLESIVVLPWNEKYTEQHIEFLAGSIRTAAHSSS